MYKKEKNRQYWAAFYFTLVCLFCGRLYFGWEQRF